MGDRSIKAVAPNFIVATRTFEQGDWIDEGNPLERDLLATSNHRRVR